jgi:uncharacterized protein YjbJ (UPF0337 family)
MIAIVRRNLGSRVGIVAGLRRPRKVALIFQQAGRAHGSHRTMTGDVPPCSRRTSAAIKKESAMDDKRVEGLGHEVKGSLKEGAGKLTGNRSQQVEGNLEKNAGKLERGLGEVQDEMRDARRDSER